MSRASKENELTLLMRAKYGGNAVEALVGALSSVITPDQLDALLASLKNELPTADI